MRRIILIIMRQKNNKIKVIIIRLRIQKLKASTDKSNYTQETYIVVTKFLLENHVLEMKIMPANARNYCQNGQKRQVKKLYA